MTDDIKETEDLDAKLYSLRAVVVRMQSDLADMRFHLQRAERASEELARVVQDGVFKTVVYPPVALLGDSRKIVSPSPGGSSYIWRYAPGTGGIRGS